MAEDNAKNVPGLRWMVRGSEHLNMESNKGVEPDIVTEVLNP
jgi:hypothetical protein